METNDVRVMRGAVNVQLPIQPFPLLAVQLSVLHDLNRTQLSGGHVLCFDNQRGDTATNEKSRNDRHTHTHTAKNTCENERASRTRGTRGRRRSERNTYKPRSRPNVYTSKMLVCVCCSTCGCSVFSMAASAASAATASVLVVVCACASACSLLVVCAALALICRGKLGGGGAVLCLGLGSCATSISNFFSSSSLPVLVTCLHLEGCGHGSFWRVLWLMYVFPAPDSDFVILCNTQNQTCLYKWARPQSSLFVARARALLFPAFGLSPFSLPLSPLALSILPQTEKNTIL
jgi:hypothetical protein